MAKRETKESYKQTQDQRTASNADYEAARTNSNAVQSQLADSATGVRNDLAMGYSNFGNNIAPVSFNPVSASTGNLNTALTGARDFAKTGGFTPGREASIMENV